MRSVWGKDCESPAGQTLTICASARLLTIQLPHCMLMSSLPWEHDGLRGHKVSRAVGWCGRSVCGVCECVCLGGLNFKCYWTERNRFYLQIVFNLWCCWNRAVWLNSVISRLNQNHIFFVSTMPVVLHVLAQITYFTSQLIYFQTMLPF